MDKKLIDLTSFAPTQNLKDRLVERHKRIIDKNLHYIKNKSVLDLASNNGRWAYAARVAGATKVLGVEGRDDKVMEARRLIEEAGLEGKVSFCVADIFDWLFNNVEKFDTVLVLGIYYHIMDHYILLRLIKRAQPECIIVDSGFVRTFRSYIWIKRENPNEHLNALPAFQGQKEEVVGHISLGLMNQFAWNCGYICEPVLWDPHEIENKASVQDYMMGRRYTLRLTKMQNHEDPDWRSRFYPVLTSLNPKFKYLFDEKTEHLAIDDRCKG